MEVKCQSIDQEHHSIRKTNADMYLFRVGNALDPKISRELEGTQKFSSK